MGDDPSPAIPAATLVVVRERQGAAPELLMVERAQAMVFAGGALVFPGGRIDPGDRALAAALGAETDDTAARIAAIRETLEEAGLPVGLQPMPGGPALDALRAALHAGIALGEAIAGAGCTIDLDALTPFARWRPPPRLTSRVFDTFFYLARLPEDAPAARVDATENVRLLWVSAAQALADAAAGLATLIYPTRRNLERLAQFDTFAEMAADARGHRVETITPFSEDRDGLPHLCIPEGLGYPVTSEPIASARRG